MKKLAEPISAVLASIVVLVVLLIFVNRISSPSAQYEQFLTDTIQHFEQVLADNGSIIATQNEQIGTLEQAIKANLVTIEALEKANMDKVSKIISLTTEIEYLNLQLDYVPDTIYKYDTIQVAGNSYLRVPMPFQSRYDPWIEISGIVTTNDVVINRLNIKQEPRIALGYQTQGYFKPPIPIVMYHDLNPNLTPITIQNVTISEPVPWYHSPWMRRAEGFLMGIGFTKGLQWLAGSN
jgi:hypothetical protein